MSECYWGCPQYAVASDSLASVNKPLLRLELSLSAEKGDSLQKPQILVGEYTKSQLDTLISQMEAIRQVAFFNFYPIGIFMR